MDQRLALKASKISDEATMIIKLLETRGYKDQEINTICLAASKIAESITVIKSQTALLAQTMVSFINDNK